MFVPTPKLWWTLAFLAALTASIGLVLWLLAWWLPCEVPASPYKDVATNEVLTAQAVATCSTCEQPPADACIRLEQPPLLIANTSGEGSALLQICSTCSPPVPAKVRVSAVEGPLTAASSGSAGPLSPPHLALSSAVEADRAILEGTSVWPARCVPAKLAVTGLLQPGAHLVRLTQDGKPLDPVKAARLDFPFTLRSTGERPEQIEVSIAPGSRLAVPLRNEDPWAYRIEWRLELGGKVDQGVETVPGRGRKELPLRSDLFATNWWESGFLRSGARSGTLHLSHLPDSSFVGLETKSKTLQVRATLSCYSPDRQRLVNTASILGVLLLGIGISLLLNYAWPMMRRKFRLKQRLAQLDGRLAGIGRVVPAWLLSLMRIEKRRLREELRSRWSWDPETEAALDAIEPRIGALDRRIELITRAGELLKAIDDDVMLAQHELDEAERHARLVFQLAGLGRATPADLERADAALVSMAAVRLQRDSDPSAAMVEALRVRAGKVTNRPDKVALDQAMGTELKQLLDGLNALFPKDGDTSPSRATYVDAANAVAKAEIIIDYGLLVHSADSKVRDARRKRAEHLVAALQPGAQAAMRLDPARSVLDEVEQNISGKEVRDAVANAQGTLIIEVDPPTPREFQLVVFRVHLPQPGLDDAAARRSVSWKWTIDDQPIGIDDSWTVCHFFEPLPPGARIERVFNKWMRKRGSSPMPERKFNVKAVAYESGNSIISTTAGDPATARRDSVPIEGTKTYAENALLIAVVGLTITVLLAGLALVATAQDKIQSLDWLTGAAVVFGLGFAADVLKRAVQKS